jgi:ribokinase
MTPTVVGHPAPPRFVVIGAYVADCLIRTPQLPGWGEHVRADAIRTTPGGKALNQAVTLARGDARVTAVGIVGDDAFGRDLVASLAAEHIDTTALTVHPSAPTPVCLVFTRPDGQNATVWRIAEEMTVGPDDIRQAKTEIADADAVLITFEGHLPTPSARPSPSPETPAPGSLSTRRHYPPS